MGGCWYLSCFRQRPRKDWTSSSASEVLKWHQHGKRCYLRYVKMPCEKDVNVSYVGLWLSFVFSLSYQRLYACAYLHVNAFLLSVCHCHKIGDKPAINEKGSTHYRVPHFGGSFIIWRTSERANLFQTPALNCTTKTKLQPFISDMIRLAHDSNISSLDILGSSGAGYLVGGPLFWPAVKKLT